MKYGRRTIALGIIAIGVVGLAGPPAMAAAHSWDINEVFSNPDGTIQFIELKCPAGADGEINLIGLSVTSLATGNSFTFPGYLLPPTGDKHILLATVGFVILPGAPPPDHIIPAGFFSVKADTLTYHIYDTFSFAAGELPTDCITSLHDGGLGPNFTGPNTPANYADQTATVYPCAPDLTGPLGVPDGCVDAFDLGTLLGAWCSSASDPDPPGDIDPPCEGCTSPNFALADISGAFGLGFPDGCVDAFDLGALLAAWCSVAGGNPCGTCGL